MSSEAAEALEATEPLEFEVPRNALVQTPSEPAATEAPFQQAPVIPVQIEQAHPAAKEPPAEFTLTKVNQPEVQQFPKTRQVHVQIPQLQNPVQPPTRIIPSPELLSVRQRGKFLLLNNEKDVRALMTVQILIKQSPLP